MIKYLTYNQGRELYYGSGSFITANQKIPLSELRKDYWQEIDMLSYHGKYGMETTHLISRDIDKPYCFFNDYRTNTTCVVDILKDGMREIIVPCGFEKAILFPDWEIKELIVTVHGDKVKRQMLFSNSVKLMSRYIPVIVVSSVDDYLYTDTAWKDNLKIKYIG